MSSSHNIETLQYLQKTIFVNVTNNYTTLVTFDVYMFSLVSLIIWTCFTWQKNKQRLRLRKKGGRDKT